MLSQLSYASISIHILSRFCVFCLTTRMIISQWNSFVNTFFNFFKNFFDFFKKCFFQRIFDFFIPLVLQNYSIRASLCQVFFKNYILALQIVSNLQGFWLLRLDLNGVEIVSCSYLGKVFWIVGVAHFFNAVNYILIELLYFLIKAG